MDIREARIWAYDRTGRPNTGSEYQRAEHQRAAAEAMAQWVVSGVPPPAAAPMNACSEATPVPRDDANEKADESADESGPRVIKRLCVEADSLVGLVAGAIQVALEREAIGGAWTEDVVLEATKIAKTAIRGERRGK